MPKLSVWMVRASLIQMGFGFLFGALVLHHKGVPIYAWIWKLLNPHIEIMIFGWTMQFAMGVSFYALPRFAPYEPKPYLGNRYGAEYLGWGAWVLLNLGVGLACLSHWYQAPYVLLYSRLGIFTGLLLYIVMMWPRVKPLVFEAKLGEKHHETN